MIADASGDGNDGRVTTMSRPRRLLIAVLAGLGVTVAATAGIGLDTVSFHVGDCLAGILPEAVPNRVYGMMADAAVVGMLALPGIITAAIILGWRQSDTETRCRSCGYIPRGLAEPRCPECGTPI